MKSSGYVPIEFFGRVSYDSSGQLSMVSVCVNGRAPVDAYPDAGETVGEVWERAFESAKTLLITQRLATAEPESEPT